MVKSISKTKSLLSEIIASIENVKGHELNLLDLGSIENTVTNYFIICNGTSNTHVKAIVDSIEENVKKNTEEKPYSIEGIENAEWVLIDYIDVIVHVFQKPFRDRYDLENLWGDAQNTKIASNY
tara:strand:- start:193 stop:564 length:372 start_codon:yes stop_codon:yes gene_type:complete